MRILNSGAQTSLVFMPGLAHSDCPLAAVSMFDILEQSFDMVESLEDDSRVQAPQKGCLYLFVLLLPVLCFSPASLTSVFILQAVSL